MHYGGFDLVLVLFTVRQSNFRRNVTNLLQQCINIGSKLKLHKFKLFIGG